MTDEPEQSCEITREAIMKAADIKRRIGVLPAQEDFQNLKELQETVLRSLQIMSFEYEQVLLVGFQMTPKTEERLQDLIGKLKRVDEINSAAACAIMADAQRQAYRIIQRANVPEDMERVELRQTKGPTLEFTGVLIRREEYNRANDGMLFAAEVWRTQGGAWIVVWEWDDCISAKAIAAGDVMAAMDFWQWGDVGRTIAKKLKWNLRVDID